MDTEIEAVRKTVDAHDKKIKEIDERLCDQLAYIHALEAMVIQLITDQGIDENAVRSSLNAILHDRPKTDEAASKRASYLINFRRMKRSAALTRR